MVHPRAHPFGHKRPPGYAGTIGPGNECPAETADLPTLVDDIHCAIRSPFCAARRHVLYRRFRAVHGDGNHRELRGNHTIAKPGNIPINQEHQLMKTMTTTSIKQRQPAGEAFRFDGTLGRPDRITHRPDPNLHQKMVLELWMEIFRARTLLSVRLTRTHSQTRKTKKYEFISC